MIRKINSYLALAITAFFILHAGLMCLLLGGIVPYHSGYSVPAFLLLVLSAVHAVLSIFIWLRIKDVKNIGKDTWKNKQSTAIQRVLSIILLIMTIPHVINGTGMWVYQVVYIALISAHIGLSLPRALLTVGAVSSENTYKRLQIFSAVLGVAITVCSAISYGFFAMTAS